MIAIVVLVVYFLIGHLIGKRLMKEYSSIKNKKPENQEDYDMLSESRGIENMIGENNVKNILYLLMLFFGPIYFVSASIRVLKGKLFYKKKV
ncbi:hypothetical protein G9G63_09055 [Paenibacillus sp. EKM202P]|uniref:hypothetical protein n=1 Tax=unclassified Paenibacillus TaxID=185978 RepID=UPI0013ED4C63|nr:MULTISPECIES: hypothetical protein [unclassified Paenibacillus]KAF6565298.1 hypothetical protein G9G63_09055 [Paenibacillus sp. EKM202P]KAF6569376.1 hypothetical protein G9G64_13035 [Paenibacillus sp. EKM207P]